MANSTPDPSGEGPVPDKSAAGNSAQAGAGDQNWDSNARHETPTERLDRNWSDLLQELRVTQTGVQVLTGFLLTLPFQNRFSQLTTSRQDIYLITVGLAVAATCFLIAPVALHRTLFRQHARRVTVEAAHRLALIGMTLFGGAVTGVVLLIFDVVRGTGVGVTAAVVALVLLLTLWLAMPLYLRATGEK
jgi:hypothetical protein